MYTNNMKKHTNIRVIKGNLKNILANCLKCSKEVIEKKKEM